MFENNSNSAWIVINDTETEVSIDSLKVGDIVTVKAGGTIPADGIITKGYKIHSCYFCRPFGAIRKSVVFITWG